MYTYLSFTLNLNKVQQLTLINFKNMLYSQIWYLSYRLT